MGGPVGDVVDAVGSVIDPVSSVASQIPVVGPIAGPVVGAINGGPLGFASSVFGNALTGGYNSGGGSAGGGTTTSPPRPINPYNPYQPGSPGLTEHPSYTWPTGFNPYPSNNRGHNRYMFSNAFLGNKPNNNQNFGDLMQFISQNPPSINSGPMAPKPMPTPGRRIIDPPAPGYGQQPTRGPARRDMAPMTLQQGLGSLGALTNLTNFGGMS